MTCCMTSINLRARAPRGEHYVWYRGAVCGYPFPCFLAVDPLGTAFRGRGYAWGHCVGVRPCQVGPRCPNTLSYIYCMVPSAAWAVQSGTVAELVTLLQIGCGCTSRQMVPPTCCVFAVRRVSCTQFTARSSTCIICSTQTVVVRRERALMTQTKRL